MLFVIVELAVGADAVMLVWEQARCSWQRVRTSRVTAEKERVGNMLWALLVKASVNFEGYWNRR